MLKGLRPSSAGGKRPQLGLTGFPDVEGIETWWAFVARRAACLTGFPDVEGIETPDIGTVDVITSDRLP